MARTMQTARRANVAMQPRRALAGGGVVKAGAPRRLQYIAAESVVDEVIQQHKNKIAAAEEKREAAIQTVKELEQQLLGMQATLAVVQEQMRAESAAQ